MNKPATKLPKFKNNINWKKVGSIVLACLSYLFILVIIPLLFSKKNSFVYFHARQGLALMVVWVLGVFAFFVPFLPSVFALIIAMAIIYGLVNSIMQKERRLPIIGRLAL